MKGQRQKEKISRKVQSDQRLLKPEKRMPLLLTPLDLFPINPTPDNVFKYLVDSYWIESMIIKNMGKDNPLIDDAISEIYLMIYDKLEHLIELYESRGILAFCGYIKTVVNVQSRCPIHIKNKINGRLKTVGMSNEMEHDIDEQYNPEVDEIYHLKNTIL